MHVLAHQKKPSSGGVTGPRPDRRTDHNRWPVLDAALRLHMATTGAGDPVLEQAEMVEWLQYRVLSWTPGSLLSAPFDNAVLALLLATIQEARLSADKI